MFAYSKCSKKFGRKCINVNVLSRTEHFIMGARFLPIRSVHKVLKE